MSNFISRLLKGTAGISQNNSFVSQSFAEVNPTVNRRSTDSHSQGHYTLASRITRLAALLAALFVLLFAFGVGDMWGNYVYFYPASDGDNNWYADDAAFTVSFSDPSVDICDYVEVNGGGTGVWRFNISERSGTAYFKRRKNDACNGNWNQVSGTVDASHNVMYASTKSSGTMQSYVINYIHNTNQIYFDNTNSNFSGNIYFVIGHDVKPNGTADTYSIAYPMDRVAGTNLYHVEISATWEDANYYGVIASSSDESTVNGDHKWGSSNLSSEDNSGYTAAYKYVFNIEGGTYMCATSTSGNNQALTFSYCGTNHEALPKVNATQAAKKRDTGTTFSDISGSWLATLKLRGSYMKNATDTARSTITSTNSEDGDGSKTYGVIKTGTVTQSYTSLNASYYFEGWGVNSETTPSNTDATYEYNITAATTVYAFFSKLYTLTYATKGEDTGSSLSVYSIDGYSGSTTSGSSIPTGHLITLVATPATGYEVEGWYSDASCQTAYTSGSGDVTIEDNNTFKLATINANTEVYCKFQPKTYTINLVGMETTTQGTTSVDVTYNASTHMTASDPIAKPTKNGYTFGGYWTSENTGATLDHQLIDADGKWIADVEGYTGNDGAGNPTWVHDYAISLYAMWTEDTHTVSVAVSPAGAGSVQVNSSNVSSVTGVGIATKSDEMTPIALAGWKFKEWQVTSNLQMDEENYHSDYQQGTANKMKINATADNQTITAVFEPRYYLVGGELVGDDDDIITSGMPGWANYDAPFIVTNSSPLLATCTLMLTDADKTYKILVRDKNDGISYGVNTSPFEVIQDGESLLFDDANYKVFLYAKGGTTFTFKITDVDASGHPYVSLDRPHQMHMGHRRVDIDGTDHNDDTGGTLTATIGETQISNNAWFNYGSNITYTASAQSGYTLTWYTNSDYSSEFAPQPAASWPNYNVIGDENVYAKFTEKSTAVTFSATNGKVQIASTDKENTTVGITTSREITAVPNTGYSFSSWSVPGGADFSVESTSSATTTLSGLGAGTAGTLTANFTENMHAVTVSAGSGGSVSSVPALSDGKVTIGIATSATLTATPANDAWVFKNWTGDIDDGITIASGSATSATITINATADSKSITANFEPRYGLHGSFANDTPGGMPGWTGDGADFAVSGFDGIGEGEGKGVDLRCARTLEPNKEYKFRIYDRAADGRWGYSSTVTLGAGESLTLSTYGDESGKDVKIYTVGYGTYTFKITNMYDKGDGKYYPKVTVDRPTSYQFNMGCTEGGTVSAATTAGSGYAITNGQYVAAGDDIQFHAVPAAGYTFDHWYTASDYATSFSDDKDMKMNNISATVNAYAKFVPVALTFTNNGGSGDGNWNTASNWSPACVPTIDHDVTIEKPVTVNINNAKAKSVVIYNDGSTYTGEINILGGKELIIATTLRKTTDGSSYGPTTANDLYIGSGASGNGALVMGSHDGTNAATVDFYSISHGATNDNTSVNQYIGIPFNSGSVLGCFYNSWVYEVDYTANPIAWKRNQTSLSPFVGYCLISADPSGHTYQMDGTLVATTNKGVDLHYSGSGSGTEANNENLLANSWTAPIRIGAMQADDFGGAYATIYIFNSTSPNVYTSFANNYTTYTINTAEGTDVIPSMQSFSVFSQAASETLTLDYEKIVYNPAVAGTAPIAANHAPQRRTSAEEANKLRLFVQTESGYGDMVYMWERSDFSEGFENGWDGHKLFGEPVAPQLYAVTPDGNMAVNCVPDFEGTLLGFQAGTSDNVYTFTFEYTDEAEELYLRDMDNNTYTRVLTGNSYPFTTTDRDIHNRFILTKNAPQSPTDVTETGDKLPVTGARKFIKDDMLYIFKDGKLYNATGMLVE